ncbi:RlpA-like double-psi beta-barrel-protein domain-containing protein-containing protein [Lactarius hatsudake]|nr:RlpA-like double-psi beta-barrel-protein domain-containing protein-containing protein [Lactarius hatsudake]
MRSFTAILLALSLPFYALAAHGNARRHNGLAHRARGDILDKRDFSARLTFYDIDVGITACGGTYPASAFVVALNSAMFGSGYPGPHCGASIVITVNGKTATATIVDECPGCPYGGLDLTRGLFGFFADLGVGVLQGSWHYAGDGGNQPDPTTSTTHKPKPTPTPTPTPEPSPSPKHTSTSTPDPSPSPSTTSTTSKKETTTSTSTTTSTTTSKSHTSTTPSSSPSPSINPDGLAQPGGVIPDGPQNLESLNEAITNLGTLVEACQD